MVLFSEESEECLATMWFLVASNAVSKKDKMAAYRKAINSITVSMYLYFVRFIIGHCLGSCCMVSPSSTLPYAPLLCS